ncbi:MAG TPA: molybdopterin molybdotransferase MoeA, partial [Gemmatimonadales bacterium]|nr:molybdopterin molybdotransferase MoeA [Gemmatimonadales bacterium]
DGYAVRAADVTQVPTTLPVVATSAAGDARPAPLATGTAVRIFTGAPVPEGADSVVRQEDTTRDGDAVTITSRRDLGQHVRPAGGDLAVGDAALEAGTRLGPGQIALLASLGVVEVPVHPRITVGILTLGDELADPGDAAVQRAQRLGDANLPGLSALVRALGATAVPLGRVADDVTALTAAIAARAPGQLLLTAGGVSVGDHDHIPAVMGELGAEILFRRVRMRPGGPVTFARLPDGTPWLALPGNPVSAMVTGTLLGGMAIRTLLGWRESAPAWHEVGLAEPVRPDATLDLFLRVTVAGAPPVARLTGAQGSGITSSVARASHLLRVPAGGDAALPGPLAVTTFPG